MAEEVKEIKQVEEKKNNFTEKLRKNPWVVSTFVFVAISVILLVLVVSPGITGHAISESNAATQTVDLVKKAFGVDLQYQSGEEVSGIYEMTFLLNGQAIKMGSTKDFSFVRLPTGNWIRTEDYANVQPETPAEIPKTDKPKVELFVMAFCPYGVQAEQAIKPVYDLLKDKIDFSINYIVSVGGDTLDSVSSLHGAKEAEEDARQVCIAKNYPDKLWDYVIEIDNKCYPSYSKDIDTCWKQAAAKFGISTAKIDGCVKDESVLLLKASETLSNNYGVSGSPTLVINGVTYSGGRTSADYQIGICSAFNAAPNECSQTVTSSTNSTATSGTC